MFYLGIDSGGTKTLFTLCDSDGNIVNTHRSGAGYFFSIGEKGIFDLLKDGFEKCTAGINPDDVYTYCGMTLVGEHQSIDTALEHIQKKIGFKIEFGNDVMCAAAGSLMFRPGIHLIAGTGSNAIGFDLDGNSALSGGWGCEIRGDEASAYYLSIEMLHEFTKQADFRHPRTILYDCVREYFNIKNDFEICDYLTNKINMDRETIASHAVLATQLYQKGDTAIKRIFDNAAFELCQTALSIKNRLNFGETVDVSYSGGVFKSGEAILTPLEDKLKSNGMTLHKPCAEPVIGAVLLAARSANEKNINVMKEKLKYTHEKG
ncbi:MAG: acyl-CoA reductase [Clostridia bacterium]|nr:acyl-CoA reductase [Clostridia bacterium]